MKAKKMLVLLLAGVLTLGCCSMSVMAEEIDSPLMEAEVEEESAAADFDEEEYVASDEDADFEKQETEYIIEEKQETELLDATYGSYVWPVPSVAVGKITSGRGYSSDHKGIDIPAAKGATMVACKSGVVKVVYRGCNNHSGIVNGSCTERNICSPNHGTYKQKDGKQYCNFGYGNGVVVQADDGTWWSYAHMSRVDVSEGQRVTAGQTVGAAGDAGYSNGVHCHFATATSATISSGYYANMTTFDPLSQNYGSDPSTLYTFTNSATDITDTSATINGSLNTTVTTMTKAGFWFGTDTTNWRQYDENVTNGNEVKKLFYGTGKWVGTLTPGTTYFYKFYAVIGGQTYYSDVSSFTTTGTAPNKNYTLSFDAGGGTISFASVTMTLGWGNSWNVSYQNPQRANSTFLGWYDAYGHKVYEPNGECTNEGTYFRNSLWVYEGNLTVYAKWQNTITLDPKGGTIKGSATCPVVNGWGNYNSMTFQYPEKSGATFYGWYDANNWLVYDNNGNNVNDGKYFSNDAWVYPGNVTLYARWQNAIVFDPQGGALNGGNVVAPVSGFNWHYLVATPTKSGCRFYGWADADKRLVYDSKGQATREGKYFDNNNIWVYPNNVTLYAKWENTITFDAKGGTIQGDNHGYPINGWDWFHVVDGLKPQKSGYTFQGWYDSNNVQVYNASGNSTNEGKYFKSNNWVYGKDVTLYAHWKSNSTSGGNTSGGSSSGGTSATKRFVDVPDGQFYTTAVDWAVANGVTTGTSSTTFSPNDSCKRGQVVAFLWRAYGCPEPSRTYSPFTDVQDKGKYYYKAVLWAVERGITTGTTPTTFSPEDTVTRGQFVSFLYRSKGSPAVSGGCKFTDVSSGKYYYKPIIWAAQTGVTTGTSPTTFSPENPCTRGQVVTFIYRAMK